MSDFSERLKSCIGKRENTSFARKCGVSEGTIRSLVQGQSAPRLDTLLAISNVAGVTVEWLATGRGPKTYESLTEVNESSSVKPNKRMTITTVIEWELGDE